MKRTKQTKIKRTRFVPISAKENEKRIYNTLVEMEYAGRNRDTKEVKRLDKELWKLQKLQRTFK